MCAGPEYKYLPKRPKIFILFEQISLKSDSGKVENVCKVNGYVPLFFFYLQCYL